MTSIAGWFDLVFLSVKLQTENDRCWRWHTDAMCVLSIEIMQQPRRCVEFDGCCARDPINNRLDLLVGLTFLLNRARQMCSLALIQIGTSSASDRRWRWLTTHTSLTFALIAIRIAFFAPPRASKIEGRFEEPTHQQTFELYFGRVYFLIRCTSWPATTLFKCTIKQLLKPLKELYAMRVSLCF